jgi:hypothetical protein
VPENPRANHHSRIELHTGLVNATSSQPAMGSACASAVQTAPARAPNAECRSLIKNDKGLEAATNHGIATFAVRLCRDESVERN